MSTSIQEKSGPEPIFLTLSAMQQVASLIHEELEDAPSQSHLHLRISIKGGGCSGFQYQFALTPDKKNFDQVFTHLDDQSPSTVPLVVDHISYMYLKGAKIDYLEDAMGARFVVHNPNASTTCSCGDSFAID